MLPEGVSKTVPGERRADDVAKVESGVRLSGAAGDVARDIGVLVARVSRLESVLGLGVSNTLTVQTIDTTPAAETRPDDVATETATPAAGAHFAAATEVLPVTEPPAPPLPPLPPDEPATVPLNPAGTEAHATGDASQPASDSIASFLANPNVPQAVRDAIAAGRGIVGL
jgi:hypothetical protein